MLQTNIIYRKWHLKEGYSTLHTCFIIFYVDTTCIRSSDKYVRWIKPWFYKWKRKKEKWRESDGRQVSVNSTFDLRSPYRQHVVWSDPHRKMSPEIVRRVKNTLENIGQYPIAICVSLVLSHYPRQKEFHVCEKNVR